MSVWQFYAFISWISVIFYYLFSYPISLCPLIPLSPSVPTENLFLKNPTPMFIPSCNTCYSKLWFFMWHKEYYVYVCVMDLLQQASQRSFSGTSRTMTHSWWSKKSLCLTCLAAVGDIWTTSELVILTGMSASSSPTWQPSCIYHRVFNYLYDNSGLEMFLCIHFEREIIRRLQALRYRTLILS